MKPLFFLALLLALPLHAEEPKAIVINGPTAIEVTAEPYTLNNIHGEPLTPGSRKGEFTFDTALALSADTYRFGGFSSLAVANGTLFSVTDEGHVLRAQLKREKGRIVGLKDAVMAPLWPENRPPSDKEDYDAEGFVWLKKGTEFMVSFENLHRLVHYDLGKAPFVFRTRPVPDEVMALLPDNGGIESIAQLDKESYLVISEASRDPEGNIRGWIVKGNTWELLNFKLEGKFVPTDITTLPNGNFLLLERSYSLFSGMKSRISLIKKSEVKPGAVITPKQMALFARKSHTDNLEGITVLPPEKDGSVTVLLISDDNFNPMQDTILVALKLAKNRF